MSWLRLTILGLVLVPSLAWAQVAGAPPEGVTVIGQKVPDKDIQDFVRSRAVPTSVLGKVARWERGICPEATGLKSVFTGYVVQRIKTVAAKVGAPVSARRGCSANIEIVFTTKPQVLLDGVRQHHKDYLGYYENSEQADALAKVTHPIQAWYATATIDADGAPHLDTSTHSPPICFDYPLCHIWVNPDKIYDAEGTRLHDGLRSGLFNVIIVVNQEKLSDHEIGALADYIAFLALAQVRALDDCATLPSILNLLAPACTSASPTREITDSDLGYLRGIYHMTDDASLGVQQDEIAYQMKQTLSGRTQ
jgi:hypothetical protein